MYSVSTAVATAMATTGLVISMPMVPAMVRIRASMTMIVAVLMPIASISTIAITIARMAVPMTMVGVAARE